MIKKIVRACAVGAAVSFAAAATAYDLLGAAARWEAMREAELDRLQLEHYRSKFASLVSAHAALTEKFSVDMAERWAHTCADYETIRVLRDGLAAKAQEAYDIDRELAEARDAYQLEHELAGRLIESRDALKGQLDAVRAALAE